MQSITSRCRMSQDDRSAKDLYCEKIRGIILRTSRKDHPKMGLGYLAHMLSTKGQS